MLHKSQANCARTFFRKRITVMGLGLLGRGVGDISFLAEQEAKLLVTDLKSQEELSASILRLKKYPNISFVLGEHHLKDFRNTDMVLKAAGVPLDSPYVAEAKKHGVPVEMSASLTAKLSCATTIGVTGTCGKSTVTHLIYHILKTAGVKAHLGGNVRGVSTLALLPNIRSGDILVLELDSWQLQGFGESSISPSIAVFTNFMPDHMNYYRNNMHAYFNDKAHIFACQTKGDRLVVTEQSKKAIEQYFQNPRTIKSDVVVACADDFSSGWTINVPGVHNRDNVACALAAVEPFDISRNILQKAVESFTGVDGRLQYVRDVNDVAIYNDNNATSPDATLAGLQALGKGKNIVLIMGGSEKGADMSNLVAKLPMYCKSIVLYPGSGTDLIKADLHALSGVEVYEEEKLSDCLKLAFSLAKSGDIILYSPAFASFGKYFKNEYDRNDQFMALVHAL